MLQQKPAAQTGYCTAGMEGLERNYRNLLIIFSMYSWLPLLTSGSPFSIA